MPDNGEQVTFILPSGQKQSFLIPSGMSDNEAKLFVRSKRPDLFQEKPPDATAQARDVITKMGQGMQPSPLGGARPTPDQEKQIDKMLPQVDQRVKDIRSAVLAMGGAGIGSGAASAAAQGLPKFLQMMAGASGAGAGAGLGALAGGTPPKEALAGAAGTAATSAVLSPLTRWLASSKSVGAKALQAASQKAGNAPVEVSPQTNEIVDKIVQQGKLGGKIPKIITDFLDRVGPSTRQAAEAAPGPLTYDEARILQSNASQLSVNEANDLKGQLKSLIPQFAKSFGRDVQSAANAAGAGPEHAIGMQEYAAASSRNRVLGKAAKAAVGSGAAAIGGKILYDLGKNMAGKR